MQQTPLDTILAGDCRSLLPQLEAGSIDLVFADPPYNLQLAQDLYRPNLTKVDAVEDGWDHFASFDEYDRFTLEWISGCQRVLKPTGALWVISTYHSIFRIGRILQDLGFWILNTVVWIKVNPMPNFHGVRFTNSHEILIWAQKSKGAHYTFNHHAMKALNDDLQMRSDWTLPLCTGKERLRSKGAKVHSTQKPEGLLYRILLASTNPGDVVLDPYFGSGTTGAVAKKLGRHFIGIEKEAAYIRAARARIRRIQPAPLPAVQLPEKRRQPRIPIGALLEAGLLSPGQTLIFARKPEVTAILLADGQLRCGQLTGSIHSLARQLLDGAPANGWDLWLYEDHGKKLAIDHLRHKIRIGGEEHET